MKSFAVAVLSALLILGVGTVVVAQVDLSKPSATDQAKPADDKAMDKPSDAKATTPPGPSGSPSASVDVNIKEQARGDAAAPGVEGSASPRTERPARIFGLDPTAAALIGAGILMVVIIALVAMARSDSGASSRTNIDFDRRL